MLEKSKNTCFSFLDYAPRGFYDGEERGTPAMSTLEVLGLISYVVLAIVLLLVGRTELRAWWHDRGDARLRPRAFHRLWRRLAGIVLLVVVLVLLRYPPQEALTPHQMGLKILVCLALCGFLLVLALWDLRTIRHEMQHEVKTFLDNSTEEFEKFMQEHLQDKKS